MHETTQSVQIGSWTAELPVIPISDTRAITLLMTIDHGVRFIETVGAELAERFRDDRIDIVATAATLGIPLAVEVSRALGLDDYLVLQKSRKVHLKDALRATLTSITSHGKQELMLDRARLDAVRGRRVLFVDDVISTGSSAVAALDLLHSAGGDVVGAGFLLQEEDAGAEEVQARGVRLVTLGRISLREL